MEASSVHSQVDFSVKGWYIQPVVAIRRIRRTIQNWANNSTKGILIKQINFFFSLKEIPIRNLNSASEKGLNTTLCVLKSSQKLSLIFTDWIKTTVVHTKFTLFSLLLCVTALVNMKDQNSWHRAYRGIQCLAPAEAIKIQDFSGSDQGRKKYCWQVQKLVEILFTGEVAYETKI